MKTILEASVSSTSRAAAQSGGGACQLFDVSPRALQQQKAFAEPMAQSPRQLAQRMALQRMGEEEEPLQGRFAVAQREGLEEEKPLQGRFQTAQRQDEEEPLQGRFVAQRIEEEKDPLQGKCAVAQCAGLEEEEPLQAKAAVAQFAEGVPINDDPSLEREADVMGARPLQTQRAEGVAQREGDPKPNQTGLPDQLKSGVENLPGMSLDNVRVHTNSSKPAQLGALAYAQGTDIHVAPGQEQHLPHEAWHVVQQAQGRVKPTMQMKLTQKYKDLKRFKTSEKDLYRVAKRGTNEVGVKNGAAVPQPSALMVDTGETWFGFKRYRYNGAYENDCLQFAQYLAREIAGLKNGAMFQGTTGSVPMNFAVSGSHTKAADANFGQNEGTNPGIGEAYGTVPQTGATLTGCAFHIATVVAKDGGDNVTCEADAGDAGRKTPVFDMCDTDSKSNFTFHATYKTMYGDDKAVTGKLAL